MHKSPFDRNLLGRPIAVLLFAGLEKFKPKRLYEKVIQHTVAIHYWPKDKHLASLEPVMVQYVVLLYTSIWPYLNIL